MSIEDHRLLRKNVMTMAFQALALGSLSRTFRENTKRNEVTVRNVLFGKRAAIS